MELFTTVFAEATQTAQSTQTPTDMPNGGLISVLYLVGMFAILYFILIRPQKKQEKQLKKMLAALQVGDKVVTIGGICGKVSKIKDEHVFIETGSVGNPSERSVIKMERAAIKTVLTIHEEA